MLSDLFSFALFLGSWAGFNFYMYIYSDFPLVSYGRLFVLTSVFSVCLIVAPVRVRVPGAAVPGTSTYVPRIFGSVRVRENF